MFLNLLASCAAITLSFPGGNDAELASALAHKFGGPVVVLADSGGKKWPPFEVRGKSAADLWSKVKAQLRVTGDMDPTSGAIGLAPRSYSGQVFPLNNRSSRPIATPWKPGTPFGPGQETTPEFLSAYIRRTFPNRPPVEIHWFCKTLPLVISGSAEDENVWPAIGFATGFKCERTAKNVTLRLNPSEFQDRVWGGRTWPSNLTGATDREMKDVFARGAFRMASLNDIRSAMRNDNSTTTINLKPRTPLFEIAAVRYRRILDDPRRNPATTYSAYLDSVDSSMGFAALMTAAASTQAGAYTRQANGRLLLVCF